MVTVLFTRKKSIYKKLGCNCYDIERDARTWPGGEPIAAHPPCRAWGNLRHFAKPRPDEKQLAIMAIVMVRLHGGILEHPHNSQLWKNAECEKPGKKDKFGGWILNISQKWFGHRSEKRTYLYIVGIEPKDIPEYPLRLHKSNINVENMGRAEREHTPKELAIWIIKTIIIIRRNGQRKLTM